MLFEELAPVCRVISGVEDQKRADESAREHVGFGDRSLTVLRVCPYLNVNFKDHD